MNRMKIISASLLFLLVAATADAQRAVWSFRQCLDTALLKNITVNQSRLVNEVNRVDLEQSKAARIPSLSASVNEGLNFGKNIDPTTNVFVTQSYNSTNLALSSSLNLFNGLQNRNTIKQRKIDVEAGNYDIETARYNITLSITTAYLQVLFSYEILSTAQSLVEATTAQADMTQKLVNAGKLPESNLFQVRSQLATDKLSVVNAESQLAMAKVSLMQLMEIPVSDSFDIVRPEMEEPPYPLLPSNSQIYQTALQVQPQIASASLYSKSALMGIRISEGARYPRLNLNAGLNTNYASSRKTGTAVNPENYPFFEQIWDNLGQSFSLGLSIPIYSNRQIKSNIDRAKINAETIQLTEQNTKNALRKNVEQTYTDLKSAMKKYEATREQLAATELSYRNAEKKFNVGLINAIDFLIEKNNFTTALSNLIQAKYNFIFQQKILDFYLGKEIRF